MDILLDIAMQEPMALKEPEPVIQIEQYAITGINILFGVWSVQDNIIPIKNALMLKIKSNFDLAGIGIPYTYIAVSTDAVDKVQPK
jgi:small conductance mechanosensitive channel